MTVSLAVESLLIDSIASLEKRGNKALACNILNIMLRGKSIRRYSSKTKKQALLLLAIYRKILKAIELDLADINLNKKIDKRKRWNKNIKNEYMKTLASNLYVKTIESNKLIFLIKTYEFIDSLPLDLVNMLILWAPPIVSLSSNKNDQIYIIENVLSGLIVSRRLQGEVIEVRVLEKSTTPRFDLYELLNLLEIFEKTYHQNENQIVSSISEVKLSVLLTDYKQSSIYKKKLQEDVVYVEKCLF